jgi:hypothetical protein
VALPLKGRLILAFLRALVGAFKAGKTFVAQNTGFGGDLSAVTNLIGEKHLRERSLVLAVSRTRVDGRRRLNGEVPMLVTEQDAVMQKWCPMIRLRWEARPFAYNRSNPGRSARFRNMLYRIFSHACITR